MSNDEVGREDAMVIWLASLAGPAPLAYQLERLGLSSREDSLEDARTMIPLLHRAIEEAWEEIGRDD